MSKTMPVAFVGCLAVTLLISLSSMTFGAQTLNPDGINPHAESPRKKITQAQKQAAADAMKKRKAEIEARRAAEAALKNPDSAIPEKGSDNAAK